MVLFIIPLIYEGDHQHSLQIQCLEKEPMERQQKLANTSNIFLKIRCFVSVISDNFYPRCSAVFFAHNCRLVLSTSAVLLCPPTAPTINNISFRFAYQFAVECNRFSRNRDLDYGTKIITSVPPFLRMNGTIALVIEMAEIYAKTITKSG